MNQILLFTNAIFRNFLPSLTFVSKFRLENNFLLKKRYLAYVCQIASTNFNRFSFGDQEQTKVGSGKSGQNRLRCRVWLHQGIIQKGSAQRIETLMGFAIGKHLSLFFKWFAFLQEIICVSPKFAFRQKISIYKIYDSHLFCLVKRVHFDLWKYLSAGII